MIVVVGSIAYDSIETPSASREDTLGGSALYFSAAASNFSPVGMVGVVGDDYSINRIDFLRSRGVDTDGIEVKEGKTFRWSGRYLDNMNIRETIDTQLNVFQDFKPVLPEHYRDAEYLFLGNINPELQLEVLTQVKNPKYVLLDTMNLWISTQREQLMQVLKKVNGVIINDEEALQLSGESHLIRAARAVSRMGPSHVIVKKGEHGAFQLHEDSLFFTPAYPTETVIDPTGAGDTFAGGLMGYLAKIDNNDEYTFRQALIYGTLMASFCVEGFSIDRLKNVQEGEIRRRFEEFKEMTVFI